MPTSPKAVDYHIAVNQQVNLGCMGLEKKETRLGCGKTQKRAFESLSTVLSNCTLTFVFNKTFYGGVGSAEKFAN
jgi:hypothetical protein